MPRKQVKSLRLFDKGTLFSTESNQYIDVPVKNYKVKGGVLIYTSVTTGNIVHIPLTSLSSFTVLT